MPLFICAWLYFPVILHLFWDGEEIGTDVEKLEEAAQNKEDNIEGILFYWTMFCAY